jgi:hypothetical protein
MLLLPGNIIPAAGEMQQHAVACPSMYNLSCCFHANTCHGLLLASATKAMGKAAQQALR